MGSVLQACRKPMGQEEQRHELTTASAVKISTSVSNIDGDLESEQRRWDADAELAYHLAQQESATVAGPDSSPQTSLRRFNFVLDQQKAALESSGGSPGQVDKYHDLSGWKYSELRDTINTSCDAQLLEACREEFHRRLKVYHGWKAKNKSQQQVQQSVGAMDGAPEPLDGGRAPKSLYQHKASHFAGAPGIMPKGLGTSDPAQQQRYFRIPFTKDGQNKGLWYAHFDGFYIARQMEVHAGKEPILLIAGRDDLQMCELQLNETGLTRKRGAEVLEYEFEKEWRKFGGTDYIRPADRVSAGGIIPKGPGPGTSHLAQQQRYFRIPLTKDGQNKGSWYAHFDGFYIARQMEVHPGKEPILLVAGRDDTQMCELQLNETGLTQKRGAEILAYEFVKEWKKFGGTDYIRHDQQSEVIN